VRLPPFQTLLDEHGTAMHRFLVAAVGPVDADDCFQDASIAALRAYPKLRHDENLRGWLLRIAQRKAIDLHRARARRPVPVLDAGAELPGPVVDPVDGEPEIWARVRALPEKQRMAVFLRSVADLSYAEVAAVLESSEDAARKNVSEGLKHLRKELVA
jgi:DNA-directed RNA polymerase specialized sigma24 family protein